MTVAGSKRPSVTFDGRVAPQRVADLQADVWIPDDAAWAGAADSLAVAEAPRGGSGTVVATSPIYMVTDEATVHGALIAAQTAPGPTLIDARIDPSGYRRMLEIVRGAPK